MKIVKKEKVFGGFFSLEEITVEDRSKVYKRLVLVRKKAVAGLLYDSQKKKFILTSQWRPGSESEIVEVLAGITEEGESDSDVLRRECLEEVGYQVDTCERIGEFYLSPGGSTEKIALFFCTSTHKTHSGGGLEEEGESIRTIEMSLDELLEYEFEDAKTIIAVEYVRNHTEKFA